MTEKREYHIGGQRVWIDYEKGDSQSWRVWRDGSLIDRAYTRDEAEEVARARVMEKLEAQREQARLAMQKASEHLIRLRRGDLDFYRKVAT